MSNKYLTLYFAFLRTEIPHTLQILTLPTLLVLVLPRTFVAFFLVVLTGFLLYLFMEQQARDYLIAQVKNDFSYLNVNKLNEGELSKSWKSYIFVTSLVLCGLVLLASQSARIG